METVPSSSAWSGLGYFLIFFLLAFFLYVYYSITLMLLAKKTNTEGAGLAWLPIGNLVLMCRIGRRPGWWVLLAFIPLINLVILAMMWGAIADVRGKSAIIGVLAVLPVIGLFVPLVLLIGDQPALGQTPPPVDATMVSRICPNCRQPIIGNDVFCRTCGAAAPTAVRAGYAVPAGQTLIGAGPLTLMGTGSAFVAMLVYGIVGYLLLFSAMSYTPPDRKEPDLPERTSGTLVEFPVDKSPNAPTPGSVVVDDLTGGTGSTEGSPTSPSSTTTASVKPKTPPERLPPGITITILQGKGTTTATTAVYKPQKQVSPKDQIYICTLRGPMSLAEELAALVLEKTGGSQTGVQLTSSKGGSYTGTKTTTSEIAVYILQKAGTDLVVIIYAPTTAVQEQAANLAKNVGNGEGINDYPEIRNTYWVLPRTPPSGLTLIDFQVQNRSEMLAAANTSGSSNEQRQINDYVSQFIPERATYARYASSSGRNWEVIVFDYDATRSAWNTWTLLKWTVGNTMT
ncbi:MAG: DUF5684 domain-containing protein, partial [Pyrinomonadaceae bacterium]